MAGHFYDGHNDSIWGPILDPTKSEIYDPCPVGLPEFYTVAHMHLFFTTTQEPDIKVTGAP